MVLFFILQTFSPVVNKISYDVKKHLPPQVLSYCVNDQIMPQGMRMISNTATSPHSPIRKAFLFFGSISGT